MTKVLSNYDSDISLPGTTNAAFSSVSLQTRLLVKNRWNYRKLECHQLSCHFLSWYIPCHMRCQSWLYDYSYRSSIGY